MSKTKQKKPGDGFIASTGEGVLVSEQDTQNHRQQWDSNGGFRRGGRGGVWDWPCKHVLNVQPTLTNANCALYCRPWGGGDGAEGKGEREVVGEDLDRVFRE